MVKLFQAVESSDGISEALAYLKGAAAAIATEGVEVTTQVKIARPVEGIENEAHGFDLVVIATHGLGGFDRFRHGSVAERVMRHVTKPVLLVRIGVPSGPTPVLQLNAATSA
jgi:nucleotide-binding universal stress UspA family protein